MTSWTQQHAFFRKLLTPEFTKEDARKALSEKYSTQTLQQILKARKLSAIPEECAQNESLQKAARWDLLQTLTVGGKLRELSNTFKALPQQHATDYADNPTLGYFLANGFTDLVTKSILDGTTTQVNSGPPNSRAFWVLLTRQENVFNYDVRRIDEQDAQYYANSKRPESKTNMTDRIKLRLQAGRLDLIAPNDLSRLFREAPAVAACHAATVPLLQWSQLEPVERACCLLRAVTHHTLPLVEYPEIGEDLLNARVSANSPQQNLLQLVIHKGMLNRINPVLLLPSYSKLVAAIPNELSRTAKELFRDLATLKVEQAMKTRIQTCART